MKVTKKTIRGWANNSNLFFSENTTNDKFVANLKKFEKENLSEFKVLSCFQTLRGKNAKEKVIIYGWYWRGSWADPTKEIVRVYYK